MLSNSFVKCEELKDWLAAIAPEYNIPCLERFTQTFIPGEFEKVENNIKGILGLAEYCSITVDIWSNMQMRSYIGITCHFVDNDFKLHSLLLTCERFKGSHTAANVSAIVQNVIDRFNLQTKLDFIITDNAANMVSAFNLPSFDDDFVGEGEYQLTVEEFSDLKEYLYLTKHERCFAHSLQLVIRHAFQELQIPELKKVARIVSHIRKSGKAGDYLEGETRAQSANQTRWNSQLHMVRSVLKIDRTKLDTLSGLDVAEKLTSADRAKLADFQAIMEPFEQLTNRIQGIYQHFI